MRTLIFAAALFTFALSAQTDYRASVERWRHETEVELQAEDGWLAVAGLFWLKEGTNTVGSADSNNIVLPHGPEHAGSFELQHGETVFHSASGKITRMKSDSQGKPVEVEIDGLTMFVIHRGDRDGIRMKDPDAERRRDFTGLHWYPVKENYRLIAKFVPYQPPKTIAIPNVLGQTLNEERPGYVLFTLNGKSLRLEPIMEDKELFFIFRDLTAGHETYGSGRFLKADPPAGGKVVLDFNKAYNPPCAFTPFATCPLPPKENRLPVRIEAGELNYHH